VPLEAIEEKFDKKYEGEAPLELLAHYDRQHAPLEEHGPPLHGHEREIERFFMIVGAAPQLCKSFVRILDSVGNSLLPKALWWLDDRLQAGEPSQMIGDHSTLFSLARILSPLVFGQTEVLRQSPDMRDATIRVLDAMVQQGSSAAYRMREFLITSISPKRQTMTSSH
jgi:hypothetical protein